MFYSLYNTYLHKEHTNLSSLFVGRRWNWAVWNIIPKLHGVNEQYYLYVTPEPQNIDI